MPRTSVGANEWAKLRADVDLMRVRLETVRTQAQRLAEDVTALLQAPPFVKGE